MIFSGDEIKSLVRRYQGSLSLSGWSEITSLKGWPSTNTGISFSEASLARNPLPVLWSIKDLSFFNFILPN
jgi:hypothetical protein